MAPRSKLCPTCGGRNPAAQQCPVCDGKGVVEIPTVIIPDDWTPSVGDVIEVDHGRHSERRYFIIEANRDTDPNSLETRHVARDFVGSTWSFDDPRRSSREVIRVVPPSEQTLWERTVVAQLCWDDHDYQTAIADGVVPSPLDTMEGQMLAEFLDPEWHDDEHANWPCSMAELIELVAVHVGRREDAAANARAVFRKAVTEAADNLVANIGKAIDTGLATLDPD